jgi:outer membrane receptor protein involved in Fe transport
VKFGFEFRSSDLVDSWGTTRTGRYQFNTVATGNALAALLLGWTTQVDVEAGITDTHSNYFAGFVQDDWKVSRHLTLNLGLRYEIETPRTEAQNRQSGFDPYPINPVSTTPGIITYAGLDGVSKYAHDFDRNNFGPRFGFAWRPKGNDTVVRGGYGLMYGPYYDDSVSRANVAGFGDVRQFISIDNGLTPVILLKDGCRRRPTSPSARASAR